MSEIDKTTKAAWFRCNSYPDGSDFCNMANAYVQAEARARMAEFKAQHFEIETTRSKPGSREHTCLALCNYQDPRHKWTLTEWEAEFRKELSE